MSRPSITKSNVYLLDANVLIALATPEHSLNQLRAGIDATAESAKRTVKSISSLPRHEFWPDDVSFVDLPTTGIIGHRQVTDAYLAMLARKHAALLATMDAALVAVHEGAALIEDC